MSRVRSPEEGPKGSQAEGTEWRTAGRKSDVIEVRSRGALATPAVGRAVTGQRHFFTIQLSSTRKEPGVRGGGMGRLLWSGQVVVEWVGCCGVGRLLWSG